nr:hypothetical protein [Tanacetum cinerariifolium]
MALGYQNPFYLKQAQKKQQSLYDGKVLLEKHDPSVVHDSEETLQLAQESREKMKQLNKEIKPANYTKINHLSGVFVSQMAKSREELYFSNDSKTANVSKSISIPNEEFSDDTTPSVARKFLNEEAAKFVEDFKSLAKEAGDSLHKHKALELEIKRLLRAVVSQDIMSVVQKESVVDISNLQTDLERKPPMLDEIHALSKLVTSNSVPTPQESKVVNNDKVIALGMFRINPFKTFRKAKHVPNNLKASARMRPITVSQPPWGNILITRVYFVEGLGHNLFSAGQFCDSDLEVVFRRNACFIRNLEGVDLLIGLPKFKYHKEYLCPSCEQGKSKRPSHPPKPVPNSRQRKKQKSISSNKASSKFEAAIEFFHMDLCGPMRISSINGKRYVLVIVDDYSRYTWVHFIRSKDEAPAVIIKFLKRITVLLQSPVIIIRTDNGTEFKNQVLKVYFDSVGISHQMSSIRTPQQNGVVERQNRTLVEAARTMLIFSRELLFLWAEAIATVSMAFEQRSSKPGLQCMTSGQISSELDLTYAPSTITKEQPTEGELDLLFKAMYDDYFGGQPSANVENVLTAQEPQVRQTSTASTIIVDNVPIPINSSSHATNIPITSQDVDELNPNAMVDGNTFVNPFANPSTSAAIASSSSQNVDPSNMHTFYQPYPHEFQWTKDHPLEQVIGEPSRPVLTRNQLCSDGDMCIYALTVSTIEPKNVKEAMTDPAWIESMQEELLQFKRMDVWVLVPIPW